MEQTILSPLKEEKPKSEKAWRKKQEEAKSPAAQSPPPPPPAEPPAQPVAEPAAEPQKPEEPPAEVAKDAPPPIEDEPLTKTPTKNERASNNNREKPSKKAGESTRHALPPSRRQKKVTITEQTTEATTGGAKKPGADKFGEAKSKNQRQKTPQLGGKNPPPGSMRIQPTWRDPPSKDSKRKHRTNPTTTTNTTLQMTVTPPPRKPGEKSGEEASRETLKRKRNDKAPAATKEGGARSSLPRSRDHKNQQEKKDQPSTNTSVKEDMPTAKEMEIPLLAPKKKIKKPPEVLHPDMMEKVQKMTYTFQYEDNDSFVGIMDFFLLSILVVLVGTVMELNRQQVNPIR